MTAFSAAYQRVKQRTSQQTQRVFTATADPTDALLWTPDYVEAQAVTIGQLVEGAQMAIGNLTSSDMSTKLRARPTSVDSSITMRDTGIPKADEYQRPYWEVAKAARADKPDALVAGQRRLRALTDTDLQMAKVRQAQIALRASRRKTYRRVTTSDNPCELCEIAATQIYLTDDLMPIHTNCSCDIEEDTDEGDQAAADYDFSGVGDDGDQKKAIGELNENDAPASDYRKLVVVRNHGEVGPMLTWASQHFQGPQDLTQSRLGRITGGKDEFNRKTYESSKQRQVEMMQRQLSRAVNRDGSANFKRVYTRRERDDLLDQAKQIMESTREAAPKTAAAISKTRLPAT